LLVGALVFIATNLTVGITFSTAAARTGRGGKVGEVCNLARWMGAGGRVA
jgi:hypothetical protein